ncbi:glycosyltransferase family 4 protein [Vibrio sp. DW001]|uniref:glycosyltransferase family 4 protein n=1 Tax=Vibrio sp. DW001 TaxID=2912315 RepID=UPI0023B08AA1|nr:glycosyltransferase family 4 protein [Vibrio sp. DW001]WED26878.1 glycosyltransferase family 4 protein [Vibrio sp. DW001]
MIVRNYFSRSKIKYISENADWVIRDIGECLKNKICNFDLTVTHYGIRNSIVHYGSIGVFLEQSRIRLPHKSNQVVVTWFHVVSNDERTKLIPEAIKHVDVWHTASVHTRNNLVELGIPKERVVVVPLGVDLDCFKPALYSGNSKIIESAKLQKDTVIIGSFQKDGNGWGEGLDPKLIKGPDILCDVIERLAERYNIFVLLTGPARGYVKHRLDVSKIPYQHDFLDVPTKVAEYFQEIDLYMVTSREEGGPKSILESMACGVPLISTKVGMAPDMIINGENGFLIDLDNTDEIYEKACCLIDNKEIQDKFISNGIDTIKNYDWGKIAAQYYEKIYVGLL